MPYGRVNAMSTVRAFLNDGQGDKDKVMDAIGKLSNAAYAPTHLRTYATVGKEEGSVGKKEKDHGWLRLITPLWGLGLLSCPFSHSLPKASDCQRPTMTHCPTPGSGQMFDRISVRYDLLNRVMSLGSDTRWRREAVHAIVEDGVSRVLDLATGTAAVALEVARRIPAGRIVGVDPSLGMLEVGRKKVKRAGLDDRVQLSEGDGMAIPASDNSFDAAIMAFGIRNVPDRPACLRELTRVVRSGGPIALLELTEPRGHFFALAARCWKRHMVPSLGAALSSAPEYVYLEKSIRAFPSAPIFADMMRECAISDVQVRPLTFGAATLFVGRAT